MFARLQLTDLIIVLYAYDVENNHKKQIERCVRTEKLNNRIVIDACCAPVYLLSEFYVI